MRIAVVGTGYVGLVTGTALSEVGHRVVCVDIDEIKVAQMSKGVPPIYEPGLEPMIQRNVGDGRLSFTTELGEALQQAQLVFIAVGTPEGEDGSADLSYVHGVARSIGMQAPHELVVVVKSTVPVGTCDSVERILNEARAERGVDFTFRVASNPEFLKEGDAIDDFMRPDRIVVGVTDNVCRAAFEELYEPFVRDDPDKLMIMDRRSSELTKYAANAMLATRISFMNEMSRLCERVGADVDAIRRGMGADQRIGKRFLYAGPGYGGSCFPKDVEALRKTSQQFESPFRVLDAVSEANQQQREFVAQKVRDAFGGEVKGKRVALWGLAFKPGTDDVRESPAWPIIRRLTEWGAEVVAHDPVAIANFKRQAPAHGVQVDFNDDPYDALRDADALVLVTEWAEYKRPEWDRVATLLRHKVVIDLRNQYNFERVAAIGFRYFAVGRPDSSR